MVSNYKRRTNRKNWTAASLEKATKAIREDLMAVNAAAVKFGIPESTLRRYKKKYSDISVRFKVYSWIYSHFPKIFKNIS